MKTRFGFVSNSSSSSFVVGFPEDFNFTEDSVHDYFFGQSTDYFQPWDWSSRISSRDAAKSLYNHIMQQIEVRQKTDDESREDVESFNESILSVVLEEIDWAPEDVWDRVDRLRGDDFYKMSFEERNDLYEQCTVEYKQELAEFMKTLPSKLESKFGPNSQLFFFNYSDNDGSFGSTMEHGGIFDRVPHFYQSNH